MKWINAKERKPRHENNVLITDQKEVWIGDYSKRRKDSGWAVVYDGSIHIPSEDVTHWMELPKPIIEDADATN